MNTKQIEIQLLHNPKFNEDNGFGVRVLINNEETSVLELSTIDSLHIGAILLNASRKFINNANLNNYEQRRIKAGDNKQNCS